MCDRNEVDNAGTGPAEDRGHHPLSPPDARGRRNQLRVLLHSGIHHRRGRPNHSARDRERSRAEHATDNQLPDARSSRPRPPGLFARTGRREDSLVDRWQVRSDRAVAGQPTRDGIPPESTRRQKISSTKMPLKVQDWNAVICAVKADTLTITLNGEKVFTNKIEPTNQRQFGLFRYANESTVRVRKIQYRGDWPKTLPPLKQQELAQGPEQLARIPDADVPESKSWDFTGSKFKAEDFAYHWDGVGAAKRIQPTPKGLSFNSPAGEKKPDCAGLHSTVLLRGDFMATIEYTDLKTVPSSKSWGSGMSFKVLSSDQFDAGLDTRQLGPTQVTRATWQCFTPLKDYIFAGESQNNFAASGQFRLVRRGSVLYYLTADAGSSNFRLITHRPISAGLDKQLNIQADASDETAGAEFVVKSLNLRASKLVK